jgi:uncharacterized membrane protein
MKLLDRVDTELVKPLRITLRPSSAVHGRWRALILLGLIPVCGTIGLGFTLLGAWPVLPFLLMAMFALVGLLQHIERHAGDYERITVNDDRLIVDRRAAEEDEHLEFNSQWVQLVSQDIAPGETRYLALRSHGQEHPLGRNLSDDERATVGRLLRARLNALRQR